MWLIPQFPEDKNFDELTTEIYIRVPSLDFEFEGYAKFDGHDSMLWVTPLTEDGRLYFASAKKVGVPIFNANYTYHGEQFEPCEERGSCLITVDSFRSHFAYGEAFIFATL